MAVIPDVEISQRRLKVVPRYDPKPDQRGQRIQMMGRSISEVGSAIDRIYEVQRRADEREAEYAVMQATDFYKNGWNGYEAKDEQTGEYKHIPGVVDRTWKQLDADNTNCIDEGKKLAKAVREQEFYTKLSPAQKKVFDRKWVFKENEFSRAADEAHRNNAILRKKEEDEYQVAWNGQRAGEKYGSKQSVVDPRTGIPVSEWEYTANWAGLRNFAVIQGTAVTNPEILDNPNTRFEDLKWRGKMTPEELAKKRDEYEAQVFVFYKNRITALQKAGANKQSLGEYSPEECLAEADRMVAMLKNNKRNVLGPDGEKIPLMTEEQANAISAETAKARKSLDTYRREENQASYANCKVGVRQIGLDLANPKKAEATRHGLNYEAFEADLKAKHPELSEEQRVDLLEDYRKLCDYRDKYEADQAKHAEAVLKQEIKDKSQYGWIDDKGFHPASAFPEQSDYTSAKEFGENAAVWSDPKLAMAQIEAASMTGRLSRADYERYTKYGEMLMDKEAQAWWFKNYGKFNIEGLTKTEYGETDVKKDIRKSRERGVYSAASGIFAANRNVAKGYKSAADFVADTLEQDAGDNANNESLVPIEVLPKVYETVRRFARAGVDPADAVRAILQPALQEGIERDLNERLSSPDYFRKVVEDYRTYGTHFTEQMVSETASGRGTNWNADVEQFKTDNLRRQGRVKVEAAK